jgi:hypothetical protein
MNSSGPKLAQYNPSPGENTRARARVANFAQKTLAIWITWKGVATLFLCFTDSYNPPGLLFLYNARSTTSHGGRPSSGEPILATTLNDRCSNLAEI